MFVRTHIIQADNQMKNKIFGEKVSVLLPFKHPLNLKSRAKKWSSYKFQSKSQKYSNLNDELLQLLHMLVHISIM